TGGSGPAGLGSAARAGVSPWPLRSGRLAPGRAAPAAGRRRSPASRAGAPDDPAPRASARGRETRIARTASSAHLLVARRGALPVSRARETCLPAQVQTRAWPPGARRRISPFRDGPFSLSGPPPTPLRPRSSNPHALLTAGSCGCLTINGDVPTLW